jgi:hypothetical protein
MNQGSYLIINILFLPSEHKHLILDKMPCPKVPFRNRLPQHQKKELDNGFNTHIPSIYAYGQNTPTILGTVAILMVWWGGEQ